VASALGRAAPAVTWEDDRPTLPPKASAEHQFVANDALGRYPRPRQHPASIFCSPESPMAQLPPLHTQLCG